MLAIQPVEPRPVETITPLELWVSLFSPDEMMYLAELRVFRVYEKIVYGIHLAAARKLGHGQRDLPEPAGLFKDLPDGPEGSPRSLP
jgi:hypothetical protein